MNETAIRNRVAVIASVIKESPSNKARKEAADVALSDLRALALRATEPEQLEPVIHVRLNQLETWRYALGKALESLPKGREREWVWPVWNEIGELDMPNAAQEDQP